MAVLQINELSKNYGRLRALDNLSLTIESGQVYGILGPNGSGKTTTLAILLGILKKTSGSFEWFGGQYGEYANKKIGAILETPNFYPYKTAADNLDIIRHIKGSDERNFDEYLELVDLAHRKNSKFREYSLGMKQRLAIAATMIGSPEVIIFDEPTNGLDPQGIAEVRNVLRRVADSGKTVLLASHILDEVEKICDHVAIIKNGKLLGSGSVDEILSNDFTLELQAVDNDNLRLFLETFQGVRKIQQGSQNIQCVIDEELSVAQISQAAFAQGIVLTHIVARKKRLEEAFLEITKNA